jgi:hypothetical protein
LAAINHTPEQGGANLSPSANFYFTRANNKSYGIENIIAGVQNVSLIQYVAYAYSSVPYKTIRLKRCCLGCIGVLVINPKRKGANSVGTGKDFNAKLCCGFTGVHVWF